MKRHYRIAVLLALTAVFLLVVSVVPALATTPKCQTGTPPTAVAGSLASLPKISYPGPYTCTPLTGPYMGTRSSYNFQNDPLGSYGEPFLFGIGPVPDGAIWGISDIVAVGNGWLTWRPQIAGKHLAYCDGSVNDPDIEISFAQPQAAVGVMVEPDEFGWHPVTILAVDEYGYLIGAYTRIIESSLSTGGANFIGLASTARNISEVYIFTPASSWGFAFSDLQYRSAPGGTWKHWIPPAF